jgi:hypothetical protein
MQSARLSVMATQHRAGNSCPVSLRFIMTERDGYDASATAISRTMINESFMQYQITLMARAGSTQGKSMIFSVFRRDWKPFGKSDSVMISLLPSR